MKNSILFLMTFGFAKVLMAQSSVDVCSNQLKIWFSANTYESQSICKENSSPKFMACMENKSRLSSQDVVTSAHDCDRKATHSEHPIRDTRYLSFQSCEGELQAGARMRPARAHQICRWNSKPVMVSCIVKIVQGANWHSEHALQYCDFANQSYPKEIPNFVSCVIQQAPRGLGVERTAQACHDQILNRLIPNRRAPEPGPQATRPAPIHQQPPVVASGPADKVVMDEKRVRTVVPTPVEILVQESARPEQISDQKPDLNSSTNNENLPLD